MKLHHVLHGPGYEGRVLQQIKEVVAEKLNPLYVICANCHQPNGLHGNFDNACPEGGYYSKTQFFQASTEYAEILLGPCPVDSCSLGLKPQRVVKCRHCDFSGCEACLLEHSPNHLYE